MEPIQLICVSNLKVFVLGEQPNDCQDRLNIHVERLGENTLLECDIVTWPSLFEHNIGNHVTQFESTMFFQQKS